MSVRIQKGVFIMPNVEINQNNVIRPISLQFEVDHIITNKLHELGIKGSISQTESIPIS